MKKIVKKIAIYSMVGIMQISLGAAVIEASPLHNDSHSGHSQYNRHDQKQDYDSMPFNWHERRENFLPDYHRMERIDEYSFNDRFPGMHTYRWYDKRGEGFMYHGHRITNAIFFYNDDDELISIGFVHDGVFIKINADREEERSHDSFFLSWIQRH